MKKLSVFLVLLVLLMTLVACTGGAEFNLVPPEAAEVVENMQIIEADNGLVCAVYLSTNTNGETFGMMSCDWDSYAEEK